MIVSLKGQIAETIAKGGTPRRFPADVLRRAQNKLAMIEAAMVLEDLRTPPGNRLHPLAGDREGQHAIRINNQWRVCFVWKEDGAHDVEIVDYHD